ncbi:MAG: restriction endonuclease subunit S [Ramlibacter sp.]
MTNEAFARVKIDALLVAQAKAYARQLGVPYAFLCNGNEVLFWEGQREAYPRPATTFFKQDDLERRVATLAVRRELASVPIDRRIVERDYPDLAEVKTIEIKRSEVEKLLIRPGDLLMTEGGDADKPGRAALWSGEIEACDHQNHVFKVRSDRAHLLPAYLRTLAGSAYGKACFLSVAKKTTGIASINKTQLSAFPVPLPSLALQQAFERRVQRAASIVNQQAEALKKAMATFDAILSQPIA